MFFPDSYAQSGSDQGILYEDLTFINVMNVVPLYVAMWSSF